MTLPPLDPVLERFVAFLRVTRLRNTRPTRPSTRLLAESARKIRSRCAARCILFEILDAKDFQQRFSHTPFSFFNHFQPQSFSFFISISYLPFHGYRRRDFYEPVNRWQFSTTDNGGEREEEERAPFRSSKLARGDETSLRPPLKD